MIIFSRFIIMLLARIANESQTFIPDELLLPNPSTTIIRQDHRYWYSHSTMAMSPIYPQLGYLNVKKQKAKKNKISR